MVEVVEFIKNPKTNRYIKKYSKLYYQLLVNYTENELNENLKQVELNKKNFFCTKTKKDLIYVYVIIDNKKYRVNNNYLKYCSNKLVPICTSKLCRKKKFKLPCKKKTIFNNIREVNSYCKDKKKQKELAPYKRSEREKIAQKANKLLEKEKLNNIKKENKVKFNLYV